MTTPADARAVEAAFEACLHGRPVPAGSQGLAAFTDAVRSGAAAPGRPNAALAELLATGRLTDQSEPSTRTAGHPARNSRKRPHMLLTTLVAKIAAAGAVAKAAAGTGVVLVGLTVAASADALPGPVQTAFDTVSGTVLSESGGTPAEEPPAEEPGVEPLVEEPVTEEPPAEEPPAEEPGVEPLVEEPVTEEPMVEPLVEEPVVEPLVEEPVADAPGAAEHFGGWVSDQAHEDDGTPGVDGQKVSQTARDVHGPDRAAPAGDGNGNGGGSGNGNGNGGSGKGHGDDRG